MYVRLIARMSPSMLGTEQSEFDFDMPDGATVLDLLKQLASAAPAFGAVMKAELARQRPHPPLLITVNSATAGLAETLQADDIVTLYPYAIGG